MLNRKAILNVNQNSTLQGLEIMAVQWPDMMTS
jgi:hypothetical protein